MADPTEINSVYWNEEKKSWDHKMIQVEEYHGFVECQQCRRPMSHNIKQMESSKWFMWNVGVQGDDFVCLIIV